MLIKPKHEISSASIQKGVVNFLIDCFSSTPHQVLLIFIHCYATNKYLGPEGDFVQFSGIIAQIRACSHLRLLCQIKQFCPAFPPSSPSGS
jgi:hypothetical protein